jgi:hypothetical protein
VNILQNTSNTCDYLKNIAVTLPPGLLANPEEVTTLCTASELSSYSCPAGSEIGSGTVSVYDYDTNQDGGYGSQTLEAAAYMLPAPSPSTLAGVGLVISLSTTPVIAVSGTATLDPQGGVVLSFDGLPQEAALGSGGVLEYDQVTAMNLTFNGTVDGNPFVIMPSGCETATSTMTSTTAQESTSLSPQSSWNPVSSTPGTPTGC